MSTEYKTVEEAYAAGVAYGAACKDYLVEHLVMWKDSGIPAPLNELQSIQAWLYKSSDGLEEMQEAMRSRMILLMKAAGRLHAEGPEAEDAAGIYKNRPEMR